MNSEISADLATADLDGVAGMKPGTLLFLSFAELVALVVLFIGWQWEWRWLSHDHFPAVIGGVFPILVPWAAAVGGATITLQGMVSHWDKSGNPDLSISNPDRLKWNAWYLMRLPLGMVFGTVGALIAVLIAGLIGTTSDGGIAVSWISSRAKPSRRQRQTVIQSP
jgi:hypothetical protein